MKKILKQAIKELGGELQYNYPRYQSVLFEVNGVEFVLAWDKSSGYGVFLREDFDIQEDLPGKPSVYNVREAALSIGKPSPLLPPPPKRAE